MNKLVLLPALTLAGCTAYDAPPEPIGPEAEMRLAERLDGRVPGPPQACVMQRQLEGNTPVDEGTILFRGQGDTLWLNRLRSPCAGMRPWHAIRVRTVGTQLCEGEIIVAYDPASGTERGSCTLGEFVPYRRP